MDFHTWGCPVFVLEALLQGGLVGLPIWEPRSITGVYLGHSPFHAVSVALILNIRTGHITPQYYVAFDGTFSIMEHKSKVAVPVNCKNLVDEHSELTTQENFIFAKERHPKKNLKHAPI